MGRPRRGESLGETGNTRLSGPVFKAVSRIVGLRRTTAAKLVSPAIQDWLKQEFPKVIGELKRVADNPAMMPKSTQTRDEGAEANSARGGTIRLPAWDSYRLAVIAAVRRRPTNVLLHDLLSEWIKPEMVRAMQEQAREMGIDPSDFAAVEEKEKPKKRG
jgi:hypothetical protein